MQEPAQLQKSQRVCAYCGSTSNLTKEHLFPKCICERSGNSMISVARTDHGDKAVGGALQIGDVCARCNNQRLSALDDYICELHDRYFANIVHPGDRIDFQFDFDRLLRWLLKTGYNVARARVWRVRADSELPKFILGEAKRPSGFRVFVQLIVPTPTSSRPELAKLGAKEIPPAPARIDLLDLRLLPGFSMAYVVSLNSYVFHVFEEEGTAPVHVRKLILKTLVRQMPGAREITRRDRVVLFSSSLDFMTWVEQNRTFGRHLELMKQHNDELKRSRADRTRKK